MNVPDSADIDPARIKERERATWSNSAPGWHRHDQVINAGAVECTRRMLERAGIAPGQRVLDIASGAGEPALTAAELVGPAGHVLGTDLVEDMLRFARRRASERGITNVEFRCVDGEELEVEPASFDAATCRWGLMFMPDPLACLRRLHAALVPGGRVGLTCWAEPERNPYASLPLRVLAAHMELPRRSPGAPGLFAFADPDRLRRTLEDAGFADVTVEEATVEMPEATSGADYCRTMQELAGPIAALIGQLPPDRRDVVEGEIAAAAEGFRSGDTLRMRGITWVAGGRKAPSRPATSPRKKPRARRSR